MKINLKMYFLLLLFAWFFSFHKALAFEAEIFTKNPKTIYANQEFEVMVKANGSIGEINAIQGELVFPAVFTEAFLIKDGGLNGFWVQEPQVKVFGEKAKIEFAAASPTEISGTLFSVLFKSTKSGSLEMDLQNLKAIKGDGSGTALVMPNKNLKIIVQKSTEPKVLSEQVKDTTPPESFDIQIVKDAKIFDNQWFASFSARDIDTGIGFYQVLESSTEVANPSQATGWENTKSPYILKDQSRKSFIYIKAVDKLGNYTIASSSPILESTTKTSLSNLKYVIITLVVVLFLWILVRKFFKTTI